MLLEDVFTRTLLVKQPGDGLQGTQPASNRNGPELNLCFSIKQKSSRNISGFQVLAVEVLEQPRANSCAWDFLRESEIEIVEERSITKKLIGELRTLHP